MQTIGMDFQYLDHTADLEFIAYGKSLGECFENAGHALFSAILGAGKEEIMEMGGKEVKEIELEAPELEILLHDWLAELLFLFDVDRMAFTYFTVEISGNGEYTLTASANYEPFDPDRHKIQTEVKAVTYHNMEIKQEGGLYTARVVCDI
ncbi:MAG: hypothetical protein A7315_02700 [Candidatus Altiarchaeales archaeon WOR_SM1_79]|nr:MAG: hypothetical protein A7315_02700 [Candidatus Altiarchaeales archaeon WOR_SM1_79]